LLIDELGVRPTTRLCFEQVWWLAGVIRIHQQTAKPTGGVVPQQNTESAMSSAAAQYISGKLNDGPDNAAGKQALLQRGLKRIDAQLAEEEECFAKAAVRRQNFLTTSLEKFHLVGPVLLLSRCPIPLYICSVVINLRVWFSIFTHSVPSFRTSMILYPVYIVVSVLSGVVWGTRGGSMEMRDEHLRRIGQLKAERDLLMDKVLADAL
jgi:hypothetical protein